MLKKHTQLFFFHSIRSLCQRDFKVFFYKKKTFFSLGICFVLLSCFFLFPKRALAERLPVPSKKFSSTRITAPSRKKEKKTPIIEQCHTIKKETSRYSIDVEYPSIGFIHTDADIANWAKQLTNFFILGLSQISSDDPTHFSLYVRYQKTDPSLHVTSIIFFTTTETGNTIPEHGIVTLSYKNQLGKRLSLEELFENKEGLFTFLSNYTRSQLSLRDFEKSDYKKRLLGTSPDPINFSLFSLTKKGLTIYFAPNQVESPSEGTISVDIPLEKILQFKPDITLWEKIPSKHKSRDK